MLTIELKLLEGTSNEGWVRHIAGATTLVKFRGPQGYNTDFEKALFLAQAGPTVSGLDIKSKKTESCLIRRPVH